MTSIEWAHPPGFLGDTWNPTLGCDKISPGCKHCYAIRSVNRMAGNPNEKMKAANAGLVVMTGAGLNWTGKVNSLPERLSIPFRRKQPTCWFVNSLSDLFHQEIPDEFIDRVLGVMALCPQHRFMILTKRPGRMLAYLNRLCRIRLAGWPNEDEMRMYAVHEDFIGDTAWLYRRHPWPLPNVWMGVSVENELTAHERLPVLLETPAAVRFVSYEPALGPVDFTPYLWGRLEPCADCPRDADCLCGFRTRKDLGLTALDQIIVGGESGPSARDFEVAWARDTIAQCKASRTACFVKQVGSKPMLTGLNGVNRDWPWGFPMKDKKGGNPDEWPEDLRVREFPA